MEYENRLFARFVEFCRDCMTECTRFMWAFYGGVVDTRTAVSALRNSQDARETTR
ncbi:hypothetical protein GA0070616_2371 [Micromonospora nigra]|uniref:Uncharacterized protein n=1 Tax=Micromonospora nigra TaxID=145857 RepID=A0A1C6RX06_9ACTN|nr:hypothetical protein [Micromonospora nigra]SCL21738.1 hypothetical protein GA0070616_2371 [Micromonospora nigra]